jgi:hypothetical protein
MLPARSTMFLVTRTSRPLVLFFYSLFSRPSASSRFTSIPTRNLPTLACILRTPFSPSATLPHSTTSTFPLSKSSLRTPQPHHYNSQPKNLTRGVQQKEGRPRSQSRASKASRVRDRDYKSTNTRSCDCTIMDLPIDTRENTKAGMVQGSS